MSKDFSTEWDKFRATLTANPVAKKYEEILSVWMASNFFFAGIMLWLGYIVGTDFTAGFGPWLGLASSFALWLLMVVAWWKAIFDVYQLVMHPEASDLLNAVRRPQDRRR
jgi:hypothetical protein